ncbi:MAG: DNA polymerase I [Eubacterium sp.]|nr:DNA polymerase I [Eubacterium sp.]
MSEKIVLIDGHSILNRAFYGIPDLTNAAGLHTNAVYGFLNILFKILDEEQPDYLTVAFDVHAPTFRHKMYAQYKGTRKPMAEELREQVPVIKKMLTAMGIRIVEKEGYEADDILGTISRMAQEAGLSVSVVSGDRDLLQLATERVKIRIPKTKRTGTEIEDYYAADVLERYQVTPEQFIDVKALMGDASDNIPGVPGIGEKTATNLIVAYGSIENAYAHLEEIKPKRAKENLKEYYGLAQLSKTLASIDVNARISYELLEAKIQDFYTEEAYLLCKELEFKNMLSRFELDTKKSGAEEYFCRIEEFAQAEAWLKEAEESGFFGLAPVVKDGRLYGAAVCFGEQKTAYLPVLGFLTESYLKDRLRGMLLGGALASVHDLKDQVKFFGILEGGAAARKNLFDCGIAAYLLNPLQNEYPYEDIAKNYLGMMIPSQADLLGKLNLADGMQEKQEEAFRCACYMAYTAYRAKGPLIARLKETGMQALYEEIELPLVYVLADMEQEGIAADKGALAAYGESLVARITQLEQSVWKQAGEEFNINSPKQLGVILFDKLKMPYGKKTKTGYSTAAEVLERLAPEYPIVADILEYRQLTKLKSTYADGLANFIDETERIHSTFHQTITATGRISSTDPNLQNIPIRMELGRLIRKVFLPAEGCIFVDADYSQIELRVLAHMSGDEQLILAYQQEKDIHRTTASQVFHVPFEEVTDLQRRNAKAVNFGIVYGISSFGLSQDLSISKKEAADYIERYFETYPKIKAFLDGLVDDAKKRGYSLTLFGRRRPVPELSSGNFMQRSFGERVAMNAPIQGTAADIIKIAMIRVHGRLLAEGLRSKLILQVHDELLIEARKEELSDVKRILKEEMGKAAELSVALEVDMHTGMNWYEAK